MQGRNRNPYSNDGRGYNSNYRNFNRSSSGSFGRNKPYLPPPPPPPPPRRKEEILMHAGRLAAEYLVYKGLLPPEVLTSKRHNGDYQDFKGHNRDFPVPDGRTSALNRLGSLNSDMGYGRRRYSDDYNDRMGPRDQFRGKKRMSPYGREYGSDWGRENGRWMGRNRGFNDMEDEDDFAPGYSRDRRSGFDQLPSRSENTMESGSENHEIVEDTGSKASSSSTRKELDGDLSKAVADDGKAINQEAGDEAKSNALVEESDVQPSETEEDSKNGDDLKKLCSFASVPTKPRSSSAQRSPKKDQEPTAEASITAEGSSVEDNEGDGLKELPTDQTGMKSQEPENLEITADQPVVESNQQQELSQNPQGFGSSTIGEIEESNKKEGVKRQRESSSGDEPSRMHNVRAKQSSPEIEKPLIDEEQVEPVTVVERLPMDEEMVAPVSSDQEKPLVDPFIPKVETELNDKVEEDKELLPSSFKICDLNLMQGPEITEIPDDPDPEHLRSSTPRQETGKELAMDFGLSIGNNSNGGDEFGRLSGDEKVVQVIDLEDDTAINAGAGDSSKPKDEPIYPNLDSFLNQPEHADLSGIQDGYSLAYSEFLGSDISRCPSVPSDLNNLDNGMGLHDAEGVPNDDDSIYVSLGEIPIGFMEVWDQPPQEYGKFF
ncbi:uncharacterized protein At4g26450 isoform X3 [Asparagus officinalis]|uniref:uncharacterized protein At4g26450 isoform X1 n=1 Tax=Asparagus officinalis TaxID=4686 RepID=UPI00098DE36B|nr:uncharacterized protein At4g26450 isoform X1 [Asparagus officinalis]XP_020260041.1 uncharacterized protein At4g26450 isoform X2 [Asparagus officinalis]XP_020260042.1 uncharacterized protein At4g26450 isoform X3 [Asparagus officinalis]